MHLARRSRRGFTLVELLVISVVLAVLAAVVLPRFVCASARSREAALRSDLQLVRNAVSLFRDDTGAYPRSLAALSATAAPTAGLDADGTRKTIAVADWRGPYLESVPSDPISGKAFRYSTADGSVGTVTSSASGTALNGSAYNSW